MNRNHIVPPVALLLALSTSATTALAQAQVTPPAPIMVNSTIVTINGSAGNQTDPHVDGDLVTYTDLADKSIHYYRFSTGVDTAIPLGVSLSDTLSDVSGNRVCFTRQTPTGEFEVAVFDTTTSTVTEIDPHPGNLRMGCALGGNTLVYVDYGTGNGLGDVFVYDLAANPPVPPQALSLSPNGEQNPNVSPDGNTVAWESCPTASNCDVWQAVRSSGTWTLSVVANTSFFEENPDTDGTWFTYDSNQVSSTSPDIFFQPVAGGQVTALAIPGGQVNPRISKGFIGMESTVPSETSLDIFVYDIANNEIYQVTATAGVSEQLNDISVLDNGDVRVVWTANDGFNGDWNIHATTFTPITRQVSYQVCPLYDSTVARKSGAAYPIKLQLCDASGNNLSSASIVVHAVGVTRVNGNTPAILDDTGNANPDFDFRYDSVLAGYIFNLSTKGYSSGTYALNFTAGADLVTHSVLFAVK